MGDSNDEENEKKPEIVKNALDLQRFRLKKLMENPIILGQLQQSHAENHVSMPKQRRMKSEETQFMKSTSKEEENKISCGATVNELILRQGDSKWLSKGKRKKRSRSNDVHVLNPSSEINTETSNTCTVIKSASSKEGADGNKNTTKRRNNIIQTDVLYHTSHESPVEIGVHDEDVQVPTWRINSVTNLYSMEGTENLDDGIFLKRHQKQEAYERQRKRWDLQRGRELRYQEHLKQGKTNTKKHKKLNKQQDLDSFFPSVNDILYIKVTDKIPVCAFGAPIPSFKQSEFSWIGANKNSLPRNNDASQTNEQI